MLRECEQGPCAHIPRMENDNCVHECTSPACYAQVYGEEPVRASVACFELPLLAITDTTPCGTCCNTHTHSWSEVK